MSKIRTFAAAGIAALTIVATLMGTAVSAQANDRAAFAAGVVAGASGATSVEYRRDRHHGRHAEYRRHHNRHCWNERHWRHHQRVIVRKCAYR